MTKQANKYDIFSFFIVHVISFVRPAEPPDASRFRGQQQGQQVKWWNTFQMNYAVWNETCSSLVY